MHTDTLAKYGWPIFFIVVGLTLFPSAGRDDVHISYWAAYSLVELGSVLNYNGVPVEQSSSLLHVLLLALVSAVTGASVVNVGSCLSIFFGLLALRETSRLAKALQIDWQQQAVAIAATATPLVYWSFGGLETSLVAYLVTAFVRAVVVWHLPSLDKQRRAAGVLAFLFGSAYIVTRPEAILVISAALCASMFVMLATGQSFKRLLYLQSALLLVFAALAFWRWCYYGLIFPQPVYAKVGVDLLQQIKHGLYYLWAINAQVPSLPLLLLATGFSACLVLIKRSFEIQYVFPLLLFASLLGFIVTSGGDWMEGARFMAPLIPLMAVLAASTLERLFCKRLGKTVFMTILVLGLVQLVIFSRSYSTSVPLWQYADLAELAEQEGVSREKHSWFEIANRVHLRDAIFIEKFSGMIKERIALKGDITIMTSQGGMVPYYLFQRFYGRIRLIDTAGLTTRDFPECSYLGNTQLQASSGGIGVTHAFYVQNMQALKQQCGIPFPDFIFDIDNATQTKSAVFDEADAFNVVYRQKTDVCPAASTCPPSVEGNMFVAELNDAD